MKCIVLVIRITNIKRIRKLYSERKRNFEKKNYNFYYVVFYGGRGGGEGGLQSLSFFDFVASSSEVKKVSFNTL